MKNPSDKTRRALRILDANPGIFPGDFARKMWDTRTWVQSAVGMTGGAYIDRLRNAGLIDGAGSLTEDGRAVLAEAASV